MPATGADPEERRPRRGRLSRSAEFDRVYKQGRSRSNRYLVVYNFPREGADEDARLGVSVSRKLGNSVARNRTKRLLREAFWAHAPVPAGDDVVIVARPELRDLIDRDGIEGLRTVLAELLGDEPAAPES